jgi:hypothetical protein
MLSRAARSHAAQPGWRPWDAVAEQLADAGFTHSLSAALCGEQLKRVADLTASADIRDQARASL